MKLLAIMSKPGMLLIWFFKRSPTATKCFCNLGSFIVFLARVSETWIERNTTSIELSTLVCLYSKDHLTTQNPKMHRRGTTLADTICNVSTTAKRTRHTNKLSIAIVAIRTFGVPLASSTGKLTNFATLSMLTLELSD